MNYTPSPHIDPNKIFLINRSELENRFDSLFYKEGFDFSNFIKLSKIAKISGGKRLPEGFDFSNEVTDYRYLRVGDVSWDGSLNHYSFKYLSPEVYSILKRYEIFKNDLLIAIVGATVGKVSLMNIETNEKIILTENCAKITIKGESVSPQYLAILLQSSVVQKQIQLNYIQTTLPKLGLDRVASLFLPQIPSIQFQNQIVNYYSTAFNQKQQKEAEAKALLASINAYMLDELGISLEEKNQTFYFQEPEPRYGIHYKIQKDYELSEANKLVQEGKIFLTNFSEVTGGRYDPKLYDHNTKGLKRAIENNRFKSELLKNLITQSAAGDWGKDENEVLGNDFIKCLVIRATEFDNQYNLRLDNSRVKYRWIHKDKLARIDIKENDLLIEKSGGSPDQPVGRIAIIKKNMVEKNQLCYSNFIHKIRVDTSKVNPKYLFYLLKTFHNIKLTDSMQSQTNGIRNLIMREYFNQIIPLPFAENPEKSLKKQSEIANHIQNIHSQAKDLQREAARVLEEAKREVEKMILGE